MAAWEIWQPALNAGSSPGVSISVSAKSASVSTKTKGWQLLQTVHCLEKGRRGWGREREGWACVFQEPVLGRSVPQLFLRVSGFFFSWIGSTWAFPGPLRDGRGPVLDRGYCCKWLLLQQLDLYLKREGGVVFVNTSLASRIAASASSGFC